MDSFTDEQLLNLVNNTITTKSEFDIKDFTGGGVQITSTYNHKVIKHKIYLTFGYDEKRNSKSYNEDIEKDISFIWQKAILLKVNSMQILKTGSSLSDLNKLMNTDSKIEIEDNKIEDRDRPRKQVATTSLRTPKEKKEPTIHIYENEYSNSLFLEYLALRKKMKLSNSDSVIKRLINKLRSFEKKGHSLNDVILNAINSSWKDFYEPKQQSQNQMSFKQQDIQKTDNAIDAFLEARDNGFDLRNMQDDCISDAEVIENAK